ncbi:hypothetical protein [Peristeroidobacter soli]|jgi:hypothetical protein|uniref:hypothetical protein n=1 Tax=Peristeroidobacter soli TaxID=2497877 RepID=UPI00101C5186|nr:hypothetical protein [Peristeroidobacter soli]
MKFNRDIVPIATDVQPDLMSARAEGNGDSQAGWSSLSISKWDLARPADRRSERIRLWRRRALLKRGARLHTAMTARAQSSSLAMLDETGIVVCWYGSPNGRDYASEEVVDRHMSLFYVSEEVARRQPYRDLRAAVIDGRIARQAWRRRPDGASPYWGTFDIEPVVLRDGRVQGFSYVASAPT